MKLPPEIRAHLSKAGTKGGARGKGVKKLRRVAEYYAAIGAKGGAAGSGESKTRSAAHYRRLVAIRAANRARRITSK